MRFRPMGRIIRVCTQRRPEVIFGAVHVLPSLRVAVAGEVRRIDFCETGAVVATDSASVDADCDNGVTFHVMPRHRRREGGEDLWVGGARSVEKQRRLRPSTAFELSHASWNNAGVDVPRPPRPRRRGDGATGGVASARSVEWRSLTYAA